MTRPKPKNSPWISTGEANRIFNGGISDNTFRDKFRGCITNRLTRGGQHRWLRAEVEKIATAHPDLGMAS